MAPTLPIGVWGIPGTVRLTKFQFLKLERFCIEFVGVFFYQATYRVWLGLGGPPAQNCCFSQLAYCCTRAPFYICCSEVAYGFLLAAELQVFNSLYALNPCPWSPPRLQLWPNVQSLGRSRSCPLSSRNSRCRSLTLKSKTFVSSLNELTVIAISCHLYWIRTKKLDQIDQIRSAILDLPTTSIGLDLID